MAPQQFQLVMRSGPTPGKVFELGETEMTIGRDINNAIVINDAEVSRKHARLIAQPGGYVLEDLGSTNGTFINGQRLVGPHLLRSNEIILLGENVALAFEPLSFDPNATMVAASNVPSMPAAPPREMYSPPVMRTPEPPPPPPVYTSRPVSPPPYSPPPEPVQAYDIPEEQGRSRTWIYIGCGLLVVLLCACLTLAFAFDYLNLYCTPPFDTLFAC